MKYAAFAFQTTGLNPQKGDTVLEAASVIVSRGKLLDYFHRYYLPSRKGISPGALRCHGLSGERLKEIRESSGAAYSSSWAADRKNLLKFWEFHEVSLLAGHNLAFLSAFLSSGSLKGFSMFCTMKGFREYCQIPRFRDLGRGFADDYCKDCGELKYPSLQEAVAAASRRGDLVMLNGNFRVWQNSCPRDALDICSRVACLIETASSVNFLKWDKSSPISQSRKTHARW